MVQFHALRMSPKAITCCKFLQACMLRVLTGASIHLPQTLHATEMVDILFTFSYFYFPLIRQGELAKKDTLSSGQEACCTVRGNSLRAPICGRMNHNEEGKEGSHILKSLRLLHDSPCK